MCVCKVVWLCVCVSIPGVVGKGYGRAGREGRECGRGGGGGSCPLPVGGVAGKGQSVPFTGFLSCFFLLSPSFLLSLPNPYSQCGAVWGVTLTKCWSHHHTRCGVCVQSGTKVVPQLD